MATRKTKLRPAARELTNYIGGMKLSGIGREGGLHALDFYAEPRNICIKL